MSAPEKNGAAKGGAPQPSTGGHVKPAATAASAEVLIQKLQGTLERVKAGANKREHGGGSVAAL